MKFGVVVFPGSNCALDCLHVLRDVVGVTTEPVWHQSTDLSGFDCVVLPGGFSYGDYLRAGAIARFSPVMTAVAEFARAGGPVLGICNGFQILVEAGLLPGALLRNDVLRFRCETVHLRVENAATPFTGACQPGQVLQMPIAHGEGRYHADDDTLRQLIDRGGVVLRYCDAAGNVTPASNPNGSTDNIAGIISAEGNVLGLMPHPERAAEAALGSTDGRLIFTSILRSLGDRVESPALEGVAR
ncbi:MAG TPA: phosphoribosylformylglycinamidine synthase subunit PurQ [Chloroflexota bacterium]|nr:phosphoribosylformylglycinamidine synthase subunit PurQ [Chloroflexota bacterium]